MHDNQLKYGVIGSGVLGTALANKFMQSDILNAIYCHSEKSFQIAKNTFNQLATKEFSFVLNSDVIFIAVKDVALLSVIENISNFEIQNKLIIHTSGIHNIDIMSPLKYKGAIIAAAHPFQTFSQIDESTFVGVPWGIECEEKFRLMLEKIISELEGKAINLGLISKEEKALYHLTAVIASNLNIALLDLAFQAAKSANINPQEFLPKIMDTTIKNIFKSWEQNIELPLTGPVARGDSEAIKLHMKAMDKQNLDSKTYLLLSKLAANTAFRHNIISKNQLNSILKLNWENNDNT